MSQGPYGYGGGEVPAHPFDELWYLQGEAEAQGPYKGHALKDMIEAGSIGAGSLVAKVGATQWTSIAEVPAFAAYLRGAGRGAVKFAGFWIRLLAYVIDAIILNLLALLPTMLVQMVTQSEYAGLPIGIIFALAYFGGFTSGGWQATPGKRICGIHVIREDGGRVSLALGLGRYLAYFISSLPLAVGFMMIGWTQQKQGLHDMICGTRVVYGKL
jgi:uncharacterized RDD family membrane protein YckC